MDSENSTTSDPKAAILADSKLFLAKLESGASEEQLTALLVRIKQKELQLIKEQGIGLSPELWKFLRSRFTNRKPKDIIDTDYWAD
jgi:hypothetical protein